ncbi:PucR family transcriptional regulator [Actinophytocola gossypii]|uniref:Helix-turn-helix domain-containing protein n=1 Tax=Actinophytocola gossypii TaxID=2812003 RepID=A0ABT2J314_9PSEU|nr:PucR family transcriptional regulator [Actinophytocola gossypii]MCT2582198.1 helix-turn-helix domain-containing protein [Actinophytocola gossypii]
MFTLRALLADRRLELRLLVEGRPGALDEEVLWPHNTELPDPSPYVRARELVLTNGLWLDRTEPASFVAGVVRAGGAGIVFGLRTQTPHTPPELVAACTEADLPLAEISVRVPFTALTRAAAAIYTEQRQDALLGMVRRGDALAAAISHGAGASGVLKVLRHDHDLPLAVVDRMGRPLASTGVDLTAEQRAAVADALARRPPPLEVELDGSVSAAMFPVGAVGDFDATLLCLRPAADLGPGERDALDQAARFLSLEVAKRQAVQAIEQRFASELLDMILSGAQRAAEVPERLRAFGVDPGGSLAVCAVAFADPDTPTLPGLAEAVGEFLLAENTAVVVAGGSQDVVAVLAWQRPERELRELATRLVDAVEARFPGHHPVLGLGEPAADATALRRPLVSAREACRVLVRRGGPGVAVFGELGTHRLLLGLHEPETLRGFADSVLGPLREHDLRRGGQLVVTLRTFLDHDGQWAATAAALFVHVNTLRNRLSKVTELTGRDVTRTEDRVDLYLALAADAFQR